MEHRAIGVTLDPPARRIRRAAGPQRDQRLIAHDVRGIASCLVLVADELRARGGRHAVLGDRVDRACRRLVDLGLAGAGPRPSGPARLAEVLADAEALALALTGPSTRIEIECRDAALVAGHELALFRILLNLLSNAVRATNELGGGVVRVVAGAQDGGALAVTVANAGTGLLRAPRAGLRTGSGLGLVIAEALAADLGGSLGLARGRRDGTALLLVLPGALADGTA